MLDRNQLMRWLDYDRATGLFRWKDSPSRAVKAGAIAGSQHVYGRVIVVQGKAYYARRLAWLFVHGELPREVTNLDGDVSNDRITNLGPSTSKARIGRHPGRALSGAKQVLYRNGSWSVRIQRNGKSVHHSCHATIEEAVIARDTALAALDMPSETKIAQILVKKGDFTPQTVENAL